MTTVEESVRNYNNIFIELLRENYGSLPECNDEFNDAIRAVIAAYTQEYNGCWLGFINLYDRPALRPHDGSEFVCNFDADFVLPEYNQELEEMIYARDKAGLDNLMKNTRAVVDKIKALGGEQLIWT